MANISSNASEFGLLIRSVVTWTSLTLVIAIAAVNILVIAALIANAHLNRTVRFIIINLLQAGLVVAVAAIIFHCYYGATVAQEFSADLQFFIPLCQTAFFLFLFGGAGRFLFTTLYAATVFGLVRFWNKPTIEPRNTKYFIVTAAIIWIVAFLGAAPLISRELVASVCVPSIQQITFDFYAYLSSQIVIFSLLPAILSFTLLIMSWCYLTRAVANSPSAKKTSKSMLKFGLFLLLGQGFNIAGSIIIPFVGAAIAVLTDDFPAVLMNACIFDLSLIPTPIVVTLFFTPLWEKVKMWFFRCCCHHEPTPGGAEP